MAKDKKTTRSFDLSKGEARSFDLEKKPTRTFDLKKDDDDLPSAPSQPTTKDKPEVPHTAVKSTALSASQSIPSHGKTSDSSSTSTTSTNNNEGNSKNKWVWIVLIIIALAVLAYFLMPQSEQAQTEPTPTEKVDGDTTVTIPTDSTHQDSVATASNPTETTSAGFAPEASATTEPTPEETVAAQRESKTSVPNTSVNTAATTSTGSIEDQAQQVIRGVYGNNPERRHKLGADYKAIQKRVNELMRR